MLLLLAPAFRGRRPDFVSAYGPPDSEYCIPCPLAKQGKAQHCSASQAAKSAKTGLRGCPRGVAIFRAPVSQSAWPLREASHSRPTFASIQEREMAVGQNPVPLLNIKIGCSSIPKWSHRFCPMAKSVKCFPSPTTTMMLASGLPACQPQGAFTLAVGCPFFRTNPQKILSAHGTGLSPRHPVACFLSSIFLDRVFV